jgi:hypothetical protein
MVNHKREAAPVVISTVHMPEDVWAQAKSVCRSNDWTMRAFVLRAVREKLAALAI